MARAAQKETLPASRKREGLFRCDGCGGVVCKGTRGEKVTPVLGEEHECERWKQLVAGVKT
jgi:hypothetical protein